jgi:hypothetical protein
MEWNCNTYELWSPSQRKIKSFEIWRRPDCYPKQITILRYIYIYLFIHFDSIKYIPHWRSLRAMEVNHICCGISKFSNRTLYSLKVRSANYRLQINSVFVHRKELRLLLIEHPRASCKIPIPSLILSFITGFSFISEFYHIFASET